MRRGCHLRTHNGIKFAVYFLISTSISSICSPSDSAKGLSNTDIAFRCSTTICLFYVRRLNSRLHNVFFSAAFDSIPAALMLLSPSN
jgi:hypothetical protein